MKKKCLSVCTVVCYLIVFTGGMAWAQSQHQEKKKEIYYLSLGTSLAAGVQADPETGESVLTDVSYPSLLARKIQKRIRNRELVHTNIGCPGETSETFIYGGICQYSQKSQLDEAVRFLEENEQQTKLITIDLGANDVLSCANGPDFDTSCIRDSLSQLSANLSMVLEALRAQAPNTAILGMNYYNPLSVYWFEDPATAQFSAGLQLWVNTVLETVYATYDVPVADIAEAYKSYDLVTDANMNTVPDSIEVLCGWTWMCSHQNIHANESGYGVIADQFYSLLRPRARYTKLR